MSNPQGHASPSDGDGDGDSHPPPASSSGPARNNPPLVIVSERGRHSQESRRIVRAQAARASAAQSRETRARNRGQQREGVQSPADNAAIAESRRRPQAITLQAPDPSHPFVAPSVPTEAANYESRRSGEQNASQSNDPDESRLKPLGNWMTNVLRLTASSFAAGAAVLASTGRPQLSNASDVLYSAGGILSDNGEAMEEVQVNGGLFNRRLPIALPKGFAVLQQRIQISDAFLVLLSRTACFDFGSPGVEGRLHELLYDTVMTTATAVLPNIGLAEHPLESHMRIACTCLTIFQGQRADGQSFAHDDKYNNGLEAAWAEAIMLDQNALRESNSAEAALWAVFIISVTSGSTMTFFHQVMTSLMQDLQLRHWEEVRTVLLEFIYPGSFLDEPGKQFFDNIRGGQWEQALAI